MEAPVSTAVPKQIDPGDSSNREKLQGWKEIASELGRSVRTVQRWERTLGLPVRRGKDARAEVFVFKGNYNFGCLKWLPKMESPSRPG